MYDVCMYVRRVDASTSTYALYDLNHRRAYLGKARKYMTQWNLTRMLGVSKIRSARLSAF